MVVLIPFRGDLFCSPLSEMIDLFTFFKGDRFYSPQILLTSDFTHPRFYSPPLEVIDFDSSLLEMVCFFSPLSKMFFIHPFQR